MPALNLFGLKKELVDSLSIFTYTRDDNDNDSDSDSDSGSDFDDEDLQDLSLDPNEHLKGSPYVYYSSPKLESGQVMAVYKRWFTQAALEQDGLGALKSLDPQGQSAVFLVGGGHFAAAIIQHKPKSLIRDKLNPFANIVISHHKSFHRYTTRRKQGGAQSASDNAHGKANSAGSNIRRQQEAALKAEIQQLIVDWAPALARCQVVFYHAGGRSNRGIIIGAGTPLEPTDERLRSIPMTTKRPTADEVKRVWRELTMVRTVDPPEQSTPALKLAKSVKEQSPAVKEPSPVAQVSPQEQFAKDVCAAIKKSSLTDLKKLLGTDVDQPLDLGPTPTALLYAAKQGKHQVVASLLRWGANPAVKGRKIVEITTPKVLETLQIVRKELGETRDWDKAGVGAPASAAEIEAAKAEQKKLEAAAQMQKFEKQEGQRKAEQIEKFIGKHGAGRQLGSQMGAAGLSADEQRMIEREKRARAAEARMKR